MIRRLTLKSKQISDGSHWRSTARGLLLFLLVPLLAMVAGAWWALRSDSARANRALSEALEHVAAKRYTAASNAFERVLISDPQNLRALRGLGNLAFLNGHHDRAIEYYTHAADLGDVDSLRQMAAVCIKAQDYQKLRALFPQLIQHRERDREFVNYAIICAVQCKSEEMFFQAVNGIDLNPLLAHQDTSSLISAAQQFFHLSELPQSGQGTFKE